MSHNFGELLKQYLGRQNLTQGTLAEGTAIPEVTISRMCHGQQLTGAQARPRILKIIAWLAEQNAITTREEANELLDTAVFAPLAPHRTYHEPEENALEAQLYVQLPAAVPLPPTPPPAPDPLPLPEIALPPSPSSSLSWPQTTRTTLRTHQRAIARWFGGLGILAVLVYASLWLYWYGGWYVLVEQKDDINLVLFNGELVAINYNAHEDGYARLPISDPTAAQQLTFINVNGGGSAGCRFELRYWWESHWIEPNCFGAKSYSLGLNESILFYPDGQQRPTRLPRTSPNPTAAPEILVRTPRPADLALVVVDGQVVGGAYGRSDQFQPINIAPYLQPDQDNEIKFLLWARWEMVHWELLVEHEGQRLWECHGNRMVNGEEVIEVQTTLHFGEVPIMTLAQCPTG